MKRITILLACLLCVPMLACRPHPGSVMRGSERMERQQERGAHRGLKRACRADIDKFCAGEEKGRARRACLESHLDQLGADCKSAVQDRMQRGGRRARDRDSDTGEEN